MTDQILDRLIYKEYEHFIYAISGNDLLSPKEFGLLPRSISTACYRGYYMVYVCSNNSLYLRDMTVFAETYSDVGNFSHYRSAYDFWQATTYTGSSPVNSFTGGLIIGRNLRRGIATSEKILSTSFWLASKTIIELKFNRGIVQNEIDYSDKIDLELSKQTHPDVRELMNIFPSEYDFAYPHTLANTNKTS